MLDTAKARMFPAQRRARTENHTRRCLASISEKGGGLGQIGYWYEEVMAPGYRLEQEVEDHGFLILLPLVGSVRVMDSTLFQWQVDAGQLLILPVDAGQLYRLDNLDDRELVSFIRIGWRSNEPVNDVPVLTRFDLDASPNQLQTLSGPPFNLQLGRFDGRAEGEIPFADSGEKKFVFVIEGAFEVSNRLLEARDGMLLWNTRRADFEALSNGAILLSLTVEHP